MITHKEHIIKYFESGIKDTKDFKIGIEHEKFLFDKKTNKRVDYPNVLKMFSLLSEFGWKPIMEKE
ncbi:glutamate--cysteine ligase, partial [Candidatus Pelagibacter sp.]|nr:glutamate--cysteine ligase [Candidatus Pelagibacter sp.]